MGSEKFQSSCEGTSRGKPQISLSRVASAISQLADRKGSKLTDIRNAITSRTGVEPTLLQLKTIVRKGVRDGALTKSTQNRFRVDRGLGNARETRLKRQRGRSHSVDSSHGRRRRRYRSRGRRRRRRRSRRRRRRYRRGRRRRRRGGRRRRRRRRRY